MNSITRLVQTIGWVGLSGCCAVMAQPGPADQAHALTWPSQARTEQAPRLAYSGAIDNHLSITRWRPWGDSALGVSLGVPLAGTPSTAPAPEALQLSLHWRSRPRGRWQWGLSGWADWPAMSTGAPGSDARFGPEHAAYTAQVEVQWQSARYGGLIPEYGAIGVQLQGGSRLMLRARHGGPMIYYRVRF